MFGPPLVWAGDATVTQVTVGVEPLVPLAIQALIVRPRKYLRF